MKSEAEVQHDLMLAAPSLGLRLLRNNVGVMEDVRGNFVRYGVAGKGGSDLIGWYCYEFEIDSPIGRLRGPTPAAVFTVVEMKHEGWKPPTERAQGEDAKRYRKQLAFINAVKAAGGIGCFATCIGDVKTAIEAWLRDH